MTDNKVKNYHSSTEKDNAKWKPPESGWLNRNIDASVYNGDPSFALGSVIRDEKWTLIQGKNIRLSESATVMEAKDRGLHETLI